MKKLIVLCLFALIMAGCASDSNTVFRDKIVTDFEQVFKADSKVFAAYENAADAARACIDAPTAENTEGFLAAAAESDKTAAEGEEVKSQIGDREYEVMEALDLPRTDYDYLFGAQASSMAELAGWTDIAERFAENGDTEALTHFVATQSDKLELEKVFLVYGAMDWAVNMDKDNAEYFKERLYCYPEVFPDGCEWLTEHEEIAAEYNARLDVIEEHINAEQEYLNRQTHELRQKQNE